jgi:hypothetical protein
MYFTRYARRAIVLGVFLGASLISLAQFWMSSWQPPGGVFVLFVALGGVVVAIVSDNRPLSRNEKIGWLVFTGVATFLEICVLVRADAESKRAREAENRSFAELLANARDTISNMTGGDSYAYLDYEYTGKPPLLMPKLKIDGRYALKEVQLRIIDTERQRQMTSYRSAVSVSEWASAKYKAVSVVEHITPSTPAILTESYGVDTNPSTDKSVDLEMAAPNGTWFEFLRLRLLDGKWEKAIKVMEIDPSKPPSEWKIRRLGWSPGFPTANGVPDFDS